MSSFSQNWWDIWRNTKLCPIHEIKVNRNCFCGDSNVALSRKKNLKVTIINISRELKESMPKEEEEGMTISHQVERNYCFKVEILELKSTITPSNVEVTKGAHQLMWAVRRKSQWTWRYICSSYAISRTDVTRKWGKVNRASKEWRHH